MPGVAQSAAKHRVRFQSGLGRTVTVRDATSVPLHYGLGPLRGTASVARTLCYNARYRLGAARAGPPLQCVVPPRCRSGLHCRKGPPPAFVRSDCTLHAMSSFRLHELWCIARTCDTALTAFLDCTALRRPNNCQADAHKMTQAPRTGRCFISACRLFQITSALRLQACQELQSTRCTSSSKT